MDATPISDIVDGSEEDIAVRTPVWKVVVAGCLAFLVVVISRPDRLAPTWLSRYPTALQLLLFAVVLAIVAFAAQI